ncbi:MAG: YitT family protein [Clostridia bacterium]|nr:YitT family protein [Clostridia bacterium]
MKNVLKQYAVLTFGSVVMACGIYFFKFPNNFSTGGVSALSILLAPVFPQVSAGQFMMFFNILLLAVGLLVFGKGFTFKTVYCSMLMSIFTRLFEVLIPMATPFTDQKFLELVYAILLTAAGSAILFNEGASSGGTDIVAMILKKFTSLDIGKSLLVSDFVLAAASIVVFDIETGFLSIFGLVMKAFVVDNVIDSINLSKCCIIVTDKGDKICEFIHKKLHRGATVSACRGSYTGKDKEMITTVLNRAQAVRLKLYIKEVDPTAFSIITNSSDILGKGFRSVA